MTRALIDRAAVARLVGHRLEWLYRHIGQLYADGFPRPALGTGSAERWDPAAIARWLDQKLADPTRLTIADPLDHPAIGDELDARADALAAAAAARRRA